ncbi:MAG: hypothetical protein JO225_13145 [Candidatus Eremiobacteraeota bacterium]|nr:hypothetical protein [Candidatus Eremiobacteraeota bacterium]
MNFNIIKGDDDAAALAQHGREEDDVAELDRRWKSFKAQTPAVSNEAVVRWLQTWGTPAFRKWRDRESGD